MIFFNLIGLGLALLGLAVGALSTAVLHGSPFQLVIGAIAAGGADLYVRAGQGERHWFHFRAGGHVWFIPVWIWGVVLAFCGLLGTIASLTQHHH